MSYVKTRGFFGWRMDEVRWGSTPFPFFTAKKKLKKQLLQLGLRNLFFEHYPINPLHGDNAFSLFE